MKTSLFYFSATGNSLAVARDIAEGLPEAKIYSIPQVIRGEIPLEGDCIGIIYPVYFAGLPRIVSDFIKRLNPENVKYLFVVCTFGSFAAGSLLMAEEQLKAVGIPMNAGYYVPMPGNYIVKYGAYRKEKQKKMFRNKSDAVRNIIEDIVNQKSIPVKPGNYLFNMIGNAIYKSKLLQFPTLDRNFAANDKCNKCGICAKVCPVENIHIEGQKPQWQGNCEHCMACIQWCPVEAIEYTVATEGRERYHHPDIAANDLLVIRNHADSSKNILLRSENVSDYRTVEELTREAFWNHHVPGCDEHYLLHIMRNADSFINELDIVAEVDGKIVGNIAYTKAKIVADDGNSYEAISFGPLSVLPEFQGRGIGGMLIEHTKTIAKELGYKAILIYGDPDYYSKFGFVAAETYQIGTADNMYAVPLQAIELTQGALSNCSGRFFEDAIYEVDEVAAKEFDKEFPQKELQNDLPTQNRFCQLVQMRVPRVANNS